MGTQTILIIDDEYDIISTLEMVLQLEGYDVVTAFHGLEALKILEKSVVPSLILSDVMMPVMNGYEFSKSLKQFPLLKDVPLILMSAAQIDEGQVDHSHFRLFIKKPFDLDRLLKSIFLLLDQRKGKP